MTYKNRINWKRSIDTYGGWQWKRINFNARTGVHLCFGDSIVIRIRRNKKCPWHDIIRSDMSQVDMSRDDICAELIEIVLESIGEV